ncbi:MAG: phospho-N-acetylmuramoyl-pentapeptide-transferase [Oscillospiraceae bacterium]|nr:phospho-N-acetylmuramoyl-pentapeptide-transferase [Oscillospiraceae bacterium]
MPYWINIIVGILSCIIAGALGVILIPYLRKLKAGSHILDIGPAWHKSKEGTPLMGGFMFIVSVPICTWIGYLIIKAYRSAHMIDTPENAGWKLLLAVGIAMLFMLVGFIDDYIKVVKKRNLGLSVKAKTVMQVVIVVGYLVALYFLGNTTSVVFPFIGEVNFGWFYYPLMGVCIYLLVNAVNFTDGVDGLLGSVTTVYSLAFVLIFVLLDNWEMSAFSMAVAGGCLGFLIWNLHPAKVFMGDTGSMFLGGAVVAMGMASGLELLMPLVGIIYVVEMLSDVIQILSFKIRHKRVFKMAPIHHHFELCGWSEYKILWVFSGVTLAAGALGILATYLSIRNS